MSQVSAVPYLSRALSEMYGNAVGIASSSLLVQTLFPLPVCSTAILSFRRRPTLTDVRPCRPMSADAGSVTGRSTVFENVEVAFGIASLSLSVQKLFLLPV